MKVYPEEFTEEASLRMNLINENQFKFLLSKMSESSYKDLLTNVKV